MRSVRSVRSVGSVGFVGAAAVALAACGTATSPGSSTPPALSFTASPITTSAIEFIVPLGNLNPPGHTLPTDHIYFYHHLNHPAAPAFDVFAPAAGTVTSILQHGDYKVVVKATSAHTYYLDHVILDAGIANGTALTAGQHVGVTSGASFGIDLGLTNSTVTLAFVNPSRYSDDTLHAEMPLKYFTDPLKTTLYGLISRVGADKDGQIMFDQAGRLAGNWFLEGLPPADSTTFDAGPKQIAFVRDVTDPSVIRISIGGTLALPGVWGITGNAPDPASITPASGIAGFQLAPAFGGPAGMLLVQMVTDARIRVEAFPGAAPGTVSFTGAAQIYVR